MSTILRRKVSFGCGKVSDYTRRSERDLVYGLERSVIMQQIQQKTA